MPDYRHLQSSVHEPGLCAAAAAFLFNKIRKWGGSSPSLPYAPTLCLLSLHHLRLILSIAS